MSEMDNTRLYTNKYFSKEAIEKAQDVALRTSKRFLKNSKAHVIDNKLPFQVASETVAGQAHTNQIAQNPYPSNDADDIKITPSDTKVASSTEAMETKSTKKDTKVGGVLNHLKEDYHHTSGLFKDSADILSGKRAEGTAAMSDTKAATGAASDLSELKKAGGNYLDNMGRGSKTLGAAKVGAYMVGASMLVDMLNPFDDD
jgi:hypothetical protein